MMLETARHRAVWGETADFTDFTDRELVGTARCAVREEGRFPNRSPTRLRRSRTSQRDVPTQGRFVNRRSLFSAICNPSCPFAGGRVKFLSLKLTFR